MTLQEIKGKLVQVIDEHKEEIILIGQTILRNPELGYQEEKTSELVRSQFDKLGIPYDYPVAVSGVKARLDGRARNCNVCVIGEMDAIKCAGSPIANAMGVAHACGHHAQMAAMLGAAIGLVMSGVMKELDGSVTFMATPAEEFIELDYRKKLKQEGIIRYFGGKQELIATGAFDDVDMAMMLHAQPESTGSLDSIPPKQLYVRGNNLGFLAKTVRFRGKAAHGSTPFDGINALNAASLAILGVHANRETFREEEKIRIHPIITKGGDVVNSVPDEVIIDTYIRGASFEAIQKGNHTVERAALGACEMVGAKVEFEKIPGYLPLKESQELSEVMEQNAALLIGKENLIYGEQITGSTDIGDLSSILPVIQPSITGFTGLLHSKEFNVADEETAYVLPAKLLALTVAELLYDHAWLACMVKENFTPQMTKEEYMAYLESTY